MNHFFTILELEMVVRYGIKVATKFKLLFYSLDHLNFQQNNYFKSASEIIFTHVFLIIF